MQNFLVFFSPTFFFLVGNHLKHVEMQKKKKKFSNNFFFGGGGPSPKFNGMILGPYLTPPPSFVEIRRGVFPEYCSQTNKQTNTQTHKQTNTQRTEVINILTKSLDLDFVSNKQTHKHKQTNQRSFGNKRILAKIRNCVIYT